jgi:hypothetical protein
MLRSLDPHSYAEMAVQKGIENFIVTRAKMNEGLPEQGHKSLVFPDGAGPHLNNRGGMV